MLVSEPAPADSQSVELGLVVCCDVSEGSVQVWLLDSQGGFVEGGKLSRCSLLAGVSRSIVFIEFQGCWPTVFSCCCSIVSNDRK